MKVFFLILFSAMSCYAEIRKINQIDEIMHAIGPASCVLIDMDDTLTDSSCHLGSGSWRKYIRLRLEEYEKKHPSKWNKSVHDFLTLYAFCQIPVRPVENITPQIVGLMQSQNIPVFVLTARGKSRWYDTEIENIDVLTRLQLLQAGYDFGSSKIPQALNTVNPALFSNGIFYSNSMPKGIFFKAVMKSTGYQPGHIVFVDDRLDQVESFEKIANELGIPYTGFWYTRAGESLFDPLIATNELVKLIYQDNAKEMFPIQRQSPDLIFDCFLDQIDLDYMELACHVLLNMLKIGISAPGLKIDSYITN